MQARLTTKEIELANALTVNHEKNIHIENHLAHIARLEAALAAVEPQIRELNARAAQLDRVYASVTWRLGKFLMLPVRLIRRIVRRS
jgi:maltooligosyltrehalose synthase